MNLKFATPFILAILALGLALWSWWKPVSSPQQQVTSEAPSISISTFKQVQFDVLGKKVAELAGDNLTLTADNVVIQSPTLKTQFQNKLWTITAKQADAQQRLSELDLRGNVTIGLTNDSNLQINTPQLHYSLSDKRLSSDQSVTILDPPFNFSANGIQVDLTSEKYLLSGGIRGEEKQ